jgi:hypothetical protein
VDGFHDIAEQVAPLATVRDAIRSMSVQDARSFMRERNAAVYEEFIRLTPGADADAVRKTLLLGNDFIKD